MAATFPAMPYTPVVPVMAIPLGALGERNFAIPEGDVDGNQFVNLRSGGTVLGGASMSADNVSPLTAGLNTRAFGHVYRGDTDVWERRRSPVRFATAAAAAAGNTAVFNPGAGDLFRLHGYQIELTGDAVQAVAGVITVQLNEGAATAIGLTHSFFVPAAAGAVLAHQSTPWLWLGQGFLSATAAAVLNINLSAALTGGTFRINVAVSEG